MAWGSAPTVIEAPAVSVAVRIGVTVPEELGHRPDGDPMPDLAGHQIQQRPGRALRAGQMPHCQQAEHEGRRARGNWLGFRGGGKQRLPGWAWRLPNVLLGRPV
jgi:hypothetical protein